MTLEGAAALLGDRGFELGRAITPPADPKTSEIENQFPEPGREAPLGTPVEVSFAAPPAVVPDPATTAPVAPVPPLPPGVPAEQAEQALLAAGFFPVRATGVSASIPAGAVVETRPAPGATLEKGAEVTLVVSEGFPAVVFDREDGDDIDIAEADGVDGDPVRALVDTDAIEHQPALDRAGALLAYRREDRAGGNCADIPGPPPEGRIWVAGRDGAGRGRPLTGAGFDDRRPAFSPDGRTIAFVSNRLADADDACRTSLCFVAVRRGATPTCVDDGAFVSRPTWSPDGAAILTTALDERDGQRELLLYRSRRPHSARATDWEPVGLVTDDLHGRRPGDEVIMAAWSPDPDGPAVAFTANWNDRGPQLFIAPLSGDAELGRPRGYEKIEACEIAWRSDGAELVVAQRDETCNGPGSILRVDPEDPGMPAVLIPGDASNPVFAPAP
jgi:hypothetical protein